MSAKPLARYASLNNFVELSRSLGLDPAGMVRAAGLDPASMSLQDRWVPAAAIADLLERAAAASGREDFGVRLAELRRFSNLGPLSLVIREEPDVRSALRILMRCENMFNEALHIRLVEHDGLATIRVELDLAEAGRRQSVELAVGVLYRLMAAFLGPTWQPVAVGFSHPPPVGETIHHRALGPVVRFGRDYDGLRVHSRDLDAANAMADPFLRGYAQRFLGSIEAGARSTTLDRVRELVELLLPTGRCSVEQVARSLGVNRRTVHRMLAKEGQTFTALVDSTRRGLAERLVLTRNRPLTEVAELLGFSSHSNFTRWFRRCFGCSPSQWRRRAA
ncbi:AraC family transcriptional regulator [Pseudonocardia sp.]|uniref:AraC family transcriptional regulator n=1 Tax=Pseudonocardia sp. TaxID=60912 RepID=UPI003D10633C